MGKYSAEMEMMQALFSRLKERQRDRISFGVVVPDVETQGGVAGWASELNGGPAGLRCRGSWNVSKCGAWFCGLVRSCGNGGTAWHQSQHVT